MAATSWGLRHPNIRSGRYHRGRHVNREDDINLNISADPGDNIAQILSAICQRTDLSDGKRLNYLNAFVRVTLRIDGNFENIGFKIEHILCCLRIALMHESTLVRSGGLRAIRHVLRNENDILHLNKLLIPFLIARSLDLVLKSDVERFEAMKLIRKILLLSPVNFDISLARCLVSLANGGVEERDRMLRICLATLCELGVINTSLFIRTGGVAAITRNLLECQTPKIAESLCGVLLLLLDKPSTRNQAAVNLYSIAAPYCDFHYRHGWKDKDKYVDERELRFNCSRLALLSILRSWPGILHFCNPSSKEGLRAIVEVLYLKQLEVRKAVLDVLYELLGLPQPEWTDELSVALNAIDPCEPQSTWRLNEGFVAAEGRFILPHLSKTTPSINDMHLSLLLYCFLECGLLGALVEVIATSDTFISVRATVLLGELLHLIQILLPPECCDISPPLPTLLEYATNGKPQAVKAVNGLQQLHKLLRKRPASYSIYLDFILRNGNNVKLSNDHNKKTKHKLKIIKNKIQQVLNIDGDDVIKETGVLLNKDAYIWNWNWIRLILKGDSIKLDLIDTTHRNFMKRLIDFYKPSYNRYSHMDLTSNKTSIAYTMTGIELINCLLNINNDDSIRLLKELFNDILIHIKAITNGKSVHDCLFSPQHMISTQCQSYFLFIGRLGSTEIGVNLLNDLNFYKQLEYLATTTNNDCYVKLIISSLDYNLNGPSRDLLKSVLKCTIESSRLYATQFLLILLRAGINNFSDWGIKLLIEQLYDQSRIIYLNALAILHEACEIEQCLLTLIKSNPDLKHLNEKGILLTIRYLSIQTGYQQFNQNNFIINLIKRWNDYFNYRYIKLIENEISDILTLHQRDDDGKYDKRSTLIRTNNRRDIFLPPHLYGQLSKHHDGNIMLLTHGNLDKMLQCIENGICETDQQILELKASLWAIGHFSSTINGLNYLLLHNGLIFIINLVQNCTVYSIRATAYYIIGLIATTQQGADELFKLGWLCTRHNRHISWPIIEEEQWFLNDDNNDHDDSLKLNYDLNVDLYYFDSGLKEDNSTDDDVSTSFMLLTNDTINQQQQHKSLTLPVNQNLSSSYHKRSLSESKTFEIIRDKNRITFNKLNPDISRRIRNNSTTESTTSGVSSCDSVCGAKTIYERQQLLSPIPSSCSLSTLKHQGQKIRRHSESSRRISLQSESTSDRSSQSLYTNRLSHQDLIGYATLRSLRKSPRYLEEPTYEDYDTNITLDLTTSNLNDELSDTGLQSLTSSIKRFSLNNDCLNDERCYMGISLPNNICNLFPNEYQTTKMSSSCFNDNSLIDDELIQETKDMNSLTNYYRQHDVNACLNCSLSINRNNDVFAKSKEIINEDLLQQNCPDNLIRLEILKIVDKFANPIWNKSMRQSLLQWKQRSPHIFQDLCLYSEVCKMISESMYRLTPRRILHELFIELNYNNLLDITQDILKNILDSYQEFKKHKNSDDDNDDINNEIDDGKQRVSNIKSLDSLKLAYKENKFPITKRYDPKIV